MSSAWLLPRVRLLASVTIPADLLTVQVPVGITPPPFVKVWLAPPVNDRGELPPSKVEAKVTSAWAATVPVLMLPSVRVRVPPAVRVVPAATGLMPGPRNSALGRGWGE